MRIRRTLGASLRLLTVLAMLALPAGADTPRPATIAETLNLMLSHAQKAYPDLTFALDPEERALLMFTAAEEEPSRTYPDNLHKQLARSEDAAERTAILTNFMAQIIDSPDAGIPDRIEQLRPVLRHLESYAGLDPAPLHRPYLGDMGLFYVWDKPGSVAFVTSADLEEHGLTMDSLDQIARENFDTLGPEVTVESEDIYFLTADGFYESSFLLRTELWRRIEDQLGPVLIAVPNRSIVVFQPLTSLTAKPEMRALIEVFQKDFGYALSSDLLLFRDGELTLTR